LSAPIPQADGEVPSRRQAKTGTPTKNKEGRQKQEGETRRNTAGGLGESSIGEYYCIRRRLAIACGIGADKFSLAVEDVAWQTPMILPSAVGSFGG